MDDTRDHPLSILYVDDEPGLLAIGKIYLEKTGIFTVTTASGPEEGITLLKEQPFDAIISDYQMPQYDGIAFLKYLRARKDTTPFIIFTGKGREEVVIEALNEGADFYLQKGGDPKAQFAELANKVSYAITRKRAETALRESEERYRNVVESQSEFICRFLPDGTILFINDAYCRRFNKNPKELIGTRFKPIIHKDDQGSVTRFFASLTPDNSEGIIDQRTILPDNRIVWDRWSTQAFFDDGGKVREYQSVGRDITELMERDRLLQEKNEELAASEEEIRAHLDENIAAQRQLQLSEERYRAIFENTEAATIIIEEDTSVSLANSAFAKLYGYPQEEIIGISWTAFVSQQDLERMIAFHRQRREEGGEPPGQYEFTFINRNGESRAIHLTVALIPGTRQSVASFHDLTDVKQAELALLQKNEELAGAEEELRTQLEEIISIRDMLEETNEYLGKLITYANAPIIVWDRDLRITKFNDAIGRLTGIPPKEAIGSNLEVLFPEERREESMDLIQRAMAGEMWDVVEIPILNRSRELRTVLWNSANIRAGDEETIVATIAQGQDITDRKEAEMALRESESRLRYLLGFYERAHLPEKELLAYALEGACVITGSQLGYLAFLNDDESELSMYAWSETAMKECSMQEKPIVYAVEKTGLWGEAVRQRSPVITNDYAAPNPQKKGYPEGHPEIIRHMNVPILEEDQIVIVSGVANKPLDYTDNDTHQLTILMQGLWQILKRRRIEEEFRSQQEQLAEVAGMVPGVVFQFYTRPDGEMGLHYVSERADEVFGISSSPGGFLERFTQQVDPRDRDAFLKSITDSVKTGLPWNYEGRFIRPSGEEIWFQGMSRPVQRGSEVVFNGILLDITERKEAEYSLKERIKELSCLYRISDIIKENDTPHDGMLNEIAMMIPTGFQNPGMTAAIIRVHGKEYATAGYQGTPLALQANILVQNEHVGSISISLMESDHYLPEEERLIESIALQIGRYFERIRSIDDLQKKNMDLSEAQEALHSANNKLQLLSSITRHDILNKIMALEGFLGFAGEMSVDSQQSEYLNEVRKIIVAIRNLIEFTRIYEDVGGAEPVWQPLHTLITHIGEEKNTIQNICNDFSVYADPMLERVFYNLFENTLRYADDATRISLSCEVRERELAIIWEDYGPGIPDEEKTEIFKRGFGKNSGFGLFLTREILGITGITIAETGIPGEGARFEILVPEGAWRSG